MESTNLPPAPESLPPRPPDDPHFVADLRLLTAEEGGRATIPIWSGRRCPLLFDWNAGTRIVNDCAMWVVGADGIPIGATGRVEVWLLCPDLVMPQLKVGTEFEGFVTRARGRVVDIPARLAADD